MLSVIYLVERFPFVAIPPPPKKNFVFNIILKKIRDFYSIIVCSLFLNISILNLSLLKIYTLLAR